VPRIKFEVNKSSSLIVCCVAAKKERLALSHVIYIFAARRYAIAVYTVFMYLSVCPSIRLSVRLTQVWVLPSG